MADQLEHLRWAEGLVFVYPTWWYSLPAMLKGWIDRVWVPFATFELPQGLTPVQGRMQNIRLIGAFSTYGSPWWWVRLMSGDPGRRIIMRGLRPLCHRRCRTFWLAHYRMDSSTPQAAPPSWRRSRPWRRGSERRVRSCCTSSCPALRQPVS